MSTMLTIIYLNIQFRIHREKMGLKSHTGKSWACRPCEELWMWVMETGQGKAEGVRTDGSEEARRHQRHGVGRGQNYVHRGHGGWSVQKGEERKGMAWGGLVSKIRTRMWPLHLRKRRQYAQFEWWAECSSGMNWAEGAETGALSASWQRLKQAEVTREQWPIGSIWDKGSISRMEDTLVCSETESKKPFSCVRVCVWSSLIGNYDFFFFFYILSALNWPPFSAQNILILTNFWLFSDIFPLS